MKKPWNKALAALTVAAFAVLSVPASAQLSTTANGPYYATPSWDQKLTTNRFVILANWNSEAVLDRETGLVWERSPDTTPQTWGSATFHCDVRLVGGRKGWRLPGIQELASLIDPTVAPPGPTLPAGHPFLSVQSSRYWSATVRAFFTNVAYDVDFANGVVGLFGMSGTFFVWCVRGGQGTDAQ